MNFGRKRRKSQIVGGGIAMSFEAAAVYAEIARFCSHLQRGLITDVMAGSGVLEQCYFKLFKHPDAMPFITQALSFVPQPVIAEAMKQLNARQDVTGWQSPIIGAIGCPGGPAKSQVADSREAATAEELMTLLRTCLAERRDSPR